MTTKLPARVSDRVGCLYLNRDALRLDVGPRSTVVLSVVPGSQTICRCLVRSALRHLDSLDWPRPPNTTSMAFPRPKHYIWGSDRRIQPRQSRTVGILAVEPYQAAHPAHAARRADLVTRHHETTYQSLSVLTRPQIMPVETAQPDNFTVGTPATIAFGDMAAPRLSPGRCRCRKWIQTEYRHGSPRWACAAQTWGA